MIAPNKVLSLDESALGHIAIIMRDGPRPVDLLTLYRHVANRFESLDQFLFALDLLFVLGRISVDPATRTVIYAN
jgi:hypothetical protein